MTIATTDTSSSMSMRLLPSAVRRALHGRLSLGAGALLAGLVATTSASAAPFPPVFRLATLYPAGGGDGSEGFVLTGSSKGDYAGASVSAAGDVNGDGIDDLIVGSFGTGRSLRGDTYVVFGSAQGFPAKLELGTLHPAGGGDGSRGFVLAGIDAYDYSGRSVSAAGDVNGDGVGDLIIGAEGADPGGTFDAGESYVVFGSAGAFPALLPLATLYPSGGGDGSRGFVLAGVDPEDRSGASVSAAGDVNGDGIDDLIVGAYRADPGGRTDAGESYVVFGTRQSLPAVFQLASLFPDGGGDGSRGFVLTGVDAGDTSGFAVSGGGDVNGDGVDDLAIGVPRGDRGERAEAGETYVVFGSTRGFPAVLALANLFPAGGGDGTRGFVLSGIDTFDFSGSSVSTAGDVNGDGVGDLIVGGSLGDPGGDFDAGEGYVVFGSAQGFPAVIPLASLFSGGGAPGFVLAGIESFDRAGWSVSAAGDVNRDGIDDVILGAIWADPLGNSVAGESYVVFGSAQAFPAVLPLASLYPAGGGDGSRGFVLAGADDNDWSGNSVSNAGDVNGDGTDDIIVGAYRASPEDNFSAGASFVVFGRDSIP